MINDLYEGLVVHLRQVEENRDALLDRVEELEDAWRQVRLDLKAARGYADALKDRAKKAEAARDRFQAYWLEQGKLLDDVEAEARRLRTFKQAIEAAYAEHLRTGDYIPLGITAQDALLALERDQR